MKIAVIDDYQNAFKTLKCFPKLAGHEVVVYTDTANDVASLVAKTERRRCRWCSRSSGTYFPRG